MSEANYNFATQHHFGVRRFALDFETLSKRSQLTLNLEIPLRDTKMVLGVRASKLTLLAKNL